MLKTKYLQQLIDQCEPNGTVVLPKGQFLTGSLFLKSDMTLEIPEGCTLLGSENLMDYPLIRTRIAGIDMTWPAALINAIDCQNLMIKD